MSGVDIGFEQRFSLQLPLARKSKLLIEARDALSKPFRILFLQCRPDRGIGSRLRLPDALDAAASGTRSRRPDRSRLRVGLRDRRNATGDLEVHGS